MALSFGQLMGESMARASFAEAQRQSSVVLAVLDRFLEAVRGISRERALRPIERRLEVAMRRGFLKQGRLFLARFERYKPLFPSEALREAIGIGWEAQLTPPMAETYDEMASAADTAASAAMLAGGGAAYAMLAIEGSFSLANPAAVRYLEGYGARLVSGIDETTRGYLRTVITEGVDKGWGYGKTAKAIKDRYSEFAIGVPQKHIQSRAHMIAVTEAGAAYEEAKMITGRDLAGAGLEMEKQWVVSGGDICELCLGNAAEGWIPLEQEWSGGVVAPLQHPACITPDSLVWALGIDGAYRANYSGPMVELSVANNMRLTISPNHPVATPDGWIAAGGLQEGDYVLSGLLRQGESSPVYPNIKLSPTRIDEAFGSLLKTSGMSPIVVPASAKQFHGDGIFLDSQVDIVRADCFLALSDNAALKQPPSQQRFARCGLAARLDTEGLFDAPPKFGFTPPHGAMRFLCQRHAFALAEARHTQSVSIRSTARNDVSIEQAPSEVASIYSKLQRQLLFGLAGLVSAQRIIEVRRVWYSGHVYDLQSFGSLYNANGVYVHNCRCSQTMRRKGAGA